MNENKKKKKMSLESNDTDAVKMECQEPKKSFGRKV